MSQPDLDLSVGAPPPSHLIAISVAIQPSPPEHRHVGRYQGGLGCPFVA